MARHGGGRDSPSGSGDEYDDYSQGSGVPPPPSYEEAINMGLAVGGKEDTGSKEAQEDIFDNNDSQPVHAEDERVQEPSAPPDDDKPSGAAAAVSVPSQQISPPLSSIDKYRDSKLYPLLLRVKDVIKALGVEIKRLEGTEKLGPEIESLEDKNVAAMMELVKTPDDVKGDVESEGWFSGAQSVIVDQRRYNKLLRELHNDMKCLRVWIAEQEKLDREWPFEATIRVPILADKELRDMKSSMMKVMNRRSNIEAIRCTIHPRMPLTVADYAADVVIKNELEVLWTLLSRIGDDENQVDKDNDDDDDDDDNDVLENEQGRLGQKRLKYYQNAKKNEKDSDQDEMEMNELLPTDKTSTDDDITGPAAKASLAIGGAGVLFANTEEERLRKRQQEPDDTTDEMEMLPVIKVVNENDIDIETKSLSGSSTNSYNAALDVGRYSPRASSFGDPEQVQQFEIELDETDAEASRKQQARRRHERYDVGFMAIPFMREIVNFVVNRVRYTKNHWPLWSVQRRLVFVFSVLFVVGLVLMVFLLPSSFVYVDYDKMGFVHSSLTGRTDVDRVYDYGCYLMAPQHSMVLFPATAHFEDLQLSVVNRAGLVVGLKVYFQYLLRPNELAQLFKKYHNEYEKMIIIMAESTIKNTAIEFTLEELRHNRSMVETKLFYKLRSVLSGDCCDADPKLHRHFLSPFFNDSFASQCNSNAQQCNQGFHINLAFFQLGDLTIPEEVLNHYLKQITLQLDTEREEYIQEKSVQEKLTILSVQKITNEATEIKERAKAQKFKIQKIAAVSRLQEVEMSYASSLRKTFKLLNITNEEEKTSLMYLHTLKNSKDKLIAFSYNYDQETLVSP